MNRTWSVRYCNSLAAPEDWRWQENLVNERCIMKITNIVNDLISNISSDLVLMYMVVSYIDVDRIQVIVTRVLTLSSMTSTCVQELKNFVICHEEVGKAQNDCKGEEVEIIVVD